MIDSLAALVLDLGRLGRRPMFIERERARSHRASYQDVIGAAREVAAGLHRRGVEPGDRVLLVAEPDASWAILFYGAVLAGAVVVPLDPASQARFRRAVEADTAPRLALGDGGLGVGELAAGRPIARPAARAPDELLEIVYTSGTTGRPRGVRITHGNLLANLRPVAAELDRYRLALRIVPALRFLHLIPLSHMFGQVMALFIPQLVGGTVIFEGSSPRRVVRAARRHGSNVVVCVPQQLAALAAAVSARTGTDGYAARTDAGRSIPGRFWRYRAVHRALGWRQWAFVVGGAALPERTETLWRRLGFAVISGYGLTETAPVVAVSHPLGLEAGTVGAGLPGVEVEIADDGEILVRGPNVSPGYYGDAAIAGATGWLHTGDLGTWSERGNLRILGRKKDVIVGPSGRNVHPSDVEEALGRDPRLREAAVIAAGAAGDRVHAVLVPAAWPAGEAVGREIVAAANGRLEAHQRIQSWALRREPLPRTATGKLKRAALRTSAAAGAAPPSPVAVALGGLGRAGTAGLRLDEDLGLSSLDRVELLLAIEEAAGVSVDEAALAAARTVADVERLVTAPPAPPAPAVVSFPDWPRRGLVRQLRRLVQPLLLGPALRFFIRLRVVGGERLARCEAPVLLVANHQSALDPGPIMRALPRRLRYRVVPMMGTTAFSRYLAPTGQPLAGRLADGLALFLARLLFEAVLLPTGPGLAESLAAAGRLADERYCPLLFPEGARTPDGTIGPLRRGVGVLARELGVPVVPVRIQGMSAVHPTGVFFPRWGRVTVHFGSPMTFTGETPEEITAALARLYGRPWGEETGASGAV